MRKLTIALMALAPATVAAQPQQPPSWAQLPRMQLERQFAGPLQDTVIQRWRDPVDGTICYIYLPISAAHSAPTQTGYVQYGANIIGSISCMAPPPAAPTHAQAKAPVKGAAPRPIQPPAPRAEQPAQE